MLDFKDPKWTYDISSRDRMVIRFHTSLNRFAEKGGKSPVPNELIKTQKDLKIIELVIKAAKEYMILFGRNKIIDIPVSFIHLITESDGYENNSVFGGIVVERMADDSVFAIKLFQKIFARMSFSSVRACEDRSIVLIDIGANFKEGVASLASRLFFEEVKDDRLFRRSEPIIEERSFDLVAEDAVNRVLEEVWESNSELFPKEKIIRDAVQAIVNGTIIPLLILRSKKIGPEEMGNLLQWLNGARQKLS